MICTTLDLNRHQVAYVNIGNEPASPVRFVPGAGGPHSTIWPDRRRLSWLVMCRNPSTVEPSPRFAYSNATIPHDASDTRFNIQERGTDPSIFTDCVKYSNRYTTSSCNMNRGSKHSDIDKKLICNGYVSRLYSRQQVQGRRSWRSTDIYLCHRCEKIIDKR